MRSNISNTQRHKLCNTGQSFFLKLFKVGLWVRSCLISRMANEWTIQHTHHIKVSDCRRPWIPTSPAEPPIFKFKLLLKPNFSTQFGPSIASFRNSPDTICQQVTALILYCSTTTPDRTLGRNASVEETDWRLLMVIWKKYCCVSFPQLLKRNKQYAIKTPITDWWLD